MSQNRRVTVKIILMINYTLILILKCKHNMRMFLRNQNKMAVPMNIF